MTGDGNRFEKRKRLNGSLFTQNGWRCSFNCLILCQLKSPHMKRPIFTLIIILFFNIISYAQNSSNKAGELMKQAKNNLEQKEYIKARELFIQAHKAFSEQKKHAEVVECGINVSELYRRENDYKEAFDFCRKTEAVIFTSKTRLQEKFYELHFTIIKERLQLYMQLKKPAQAKVQLNYMERLARQADNKLLDQELLYTQAYYYYTFGHNAEGDACFDKLISQYKEEKENEKVNECYKNLISIAHKIDNATLMGRTYKQFMLWNDSIQLITAQNKYNSLNHQYSNSQQSVQEKEESLTTKQSMITGLCIVAIVLIVTLILLSFVLLRFRNTTRKQRNNTEIVNEHNELKSEFIRHISTQMEPTLNTLTKSANQLPNSQKMVAQIEVLKSFTNKIQELSTLESSLAESYEMSNINNINTFCEELIENFNTNLAPQVSISVNAPKLQVKTNPEQLKHILAHLIGNAAQHTTEGKITLDFKKRGAHTYQFIVTDTGTGIPVEQQEKLFKPFTSTNDFTQGYGLGLPICALIATKLNGALTLDTSYTKGSRFILELRA